MWGYVGKYFQTADLGTGTDSFRLTMQAAASVTVDPSWTITNYCSVFSENANLTVWLFLIYEQYDENWNPVQNPPAGTPTYQIYSNNDPDGSGQYNWSSFDPSTNVNFPLSFFYPVWTPNSGVFVCVKATASAAGASPGSAVPGSELTAQINANLTSFLLTPDT